MNGFKVLTAHELYAQGVGSSVKTVEQIAQHLGINPSRIGDGEAERIKQFIADAKAAGKTIAQAIADSAPQSPPLGQQPHSGQQVNASDIIHATAAPALQMTQQFVQGYDASLGQLERSAKDFLVQRTGAVLPNIVSGFLEEVNTENSFPFPSFQPPAVKRLSLPSSALAGNDSAKQLPSAAN